MSQQPKDNLQSFLESARTEDELAKGGHYFHRNGGDPACFPIVPKDDPLNEDGSKPEGWKSAADKWMAGVERSTGPRGMTPIPGTPMGGLNTLDVGTHTLESGGMKVKKGKT